MLGVLLNRSFAHRIEKGRFIPNLKDGEFSHPMLKIVLVKNVIRFLLLSPCIFAYNPRLRQGGSVLLLYQG